MTNNRYFIFKIHLHTPQIEHLPMVNDSNFI